MRKIILTLCLSTVIGMSMAQELKTYSVYDTNQSGDVTVTDVAEVVDNVKKKITAVSTQQYVTADVLTSLFTTILEKLANVENRMAAVESKIGIEAPSTPQQQASFEVARKSLHIGDTFIQTVTTNSEENVSYYSSNPSVASVDVTSGIVTAIANGKSTITAIIPSSTHHVLAASYTIIVTEDIENDPAQMTVTGGSEDIYISKATLTAYANIPEDISSYQVGIYCSTEPEPNNTNGITVIAKNVTKNQSKYQLLVEKLDMNQKYYYRSFVYIPSTGSYYYGDILSFTTENISMVTSGESIDLGLSVKWCSHNLGSSTPEGSGERYAWGELVPYSGSYAYYSNGNFIDIGNNISGTDYDVAKATMGKNWRLPTYSEMQELFTKCAYAKSEINGIQGYIIEGNNYNSIFIPYGICSTYSGYHEDATGYTTHYNGSFSGFMTGQLSKDSGSRGRVYSLMFDITKDEKYLWYCNGTVSRDVPQAVRPVSQ